MKELKELLATHFGRDIDRIILFGSQATGKGGEDSDYDVLIILNRGYNWEYEDRLTAVIYQLELEYDIFIDTKIVSRNELNRTKKGRHPLVQHAIAQGVYA